MPDLIAQLRRAPHTFDLFQAISLLERSASKGAPVGSSVGMDETVRLGAHVDLAFAPSDVAGVDESARPGPPLTLRTAALSLAGAQGPLAAPFTELLLEQRRQRDHAGLDFLDIFNQRLLSFWYRARCKHHLALQPVPPAPLPPLLPVTAPSALSAQLPQLPPPPSAQLPQLPPPPRRRPAMAPLPHCLDALSGLGLAEGARAPAGELAWLRHAGLQGAAPRSLASLLVLLRDRIGVAFSGKQFVGHWYTLSARDQARLQGAKSRRSAAVLGMGASLGARVWDQAAGMALAAPPLGMAQFSALLPAGAQFRLLGWLVARHLQSDITVTLELALAAVPATRLGREGGQPLAPQLGRSAWLCGRDGAARPPCRYQHPRFVLSAPNFNDIKRS